MEEEGRDGEGSGGEGKEDRRQEREGDGRCGRGRQTGDGEKPDMKKKLASPPGRNMIRR